MSELIERSKPAPRALTLEDIAGMLERGELIVPTSGTGFREKPGVNTFENVECCRAGNNKTIAPKVVIGPNPPKPGPRKVAFAVNASHPCGILWMETSVMEVTTVAGKQVLVPVGYTDPVTNQLRSMDAAETFHTCDDHGLAPTFPIDAGDKGKSCVVVASARSCCHTETSVTSKQFVL